MSHIHLIVVILKLHLESKGIVETSAFLLKRVLEVTDVLSISVPSNALAIVTLCHLLRIDQRFHSLVVRTFRFHQVHKIELVSCELFRVLNSKVVPLGIRSRVVVVLKN